MRSPVYCAIWFALTLLGTAGLFFFQGAQFLGVATIVVYAGAILVTFLFVLMLCNPEGHSLYDRMSWEAGISAATGALLVGLLTWTTAVDRVPSTSRADRDDRRPSRADRVRSDARRARQEHPRAATTSRQLGGELFSKHLIAVEVAGTLLLVALVGAVAIVAHGRSSRGEVAGTGCRGGAAAMPEHRACRNSPAAQLPAHRRAAVRHRPGRLPHPAEHDRHVPRGRDDAARRLGQPRRLGPLPQRLGRPDAGRSSSSPSPPAKRPSRWRWS